MKSLRLFIAVFGVLFFVNGTCLATMQEAHEIIVAYENGDYSTALTLAEKTFDMDHSLLTAMNAPYADLGWTARVSAATIASKIWTEQSQQDLAIEKCTTELGLIPEQLPLFKIIIENARADVWASMEEYDKVLTEFKNIVDFLPNFLGYSRLAWLLATCPDDQIRDGEQALVFAQKAVEMQESWISLNALAAAYAETGNFEEAVNAEKKVIALLGSKRKNMVTVSETYLAAYDTGKPWRELPGAPGAKRGGDLTISLLIDVYAMYEAEYFVLAAVQGDIEAIRGALNRGVDINARSSIASSALVAAVTSNEIDVVKLLVEHGADKKSALGESSWAGDIDGVKILLEHWDDEDTSGLALALIYAVENGHIDIVKLLLEHGADANAKDNKGRTVLENANSKGHTEIGRLLQEAGAE